MINKDLLFHRKVEFSKDRKYRYTLEIRKANPGPHSTLTWIMLNPSTADEFQNDPTVERCERRTFKWGYERCVILNLFAYRSTDPKNLIIESGKRVDIIGPKNDITIEKWIFGATNIIVAWGDYGTINDRNLKIDHLLKDCMYKTYAFRLTKKGQPVHPLYVPYSDEPVNYGYLKRRYKEQA